LHPTTEAIAAAKRLRFWALPVAAMVGLTLLSGPFVAGNDAGHAYNTWPKMIDDWVPPEWFAAMSSPLRRWRLFFEDTAVVQFDHRCLAYASTLAGFSLYVYSLRLPLSRAACTAVYVLPITIAGQMFLGIATLLLYVPIELGVAHQAGGVAVLTALTHLLHTLRTPMIL
jgi:cytochrome c oxidase assembly protein subunit 15